jgi:hypothetical protein
MTTSESSFVFNLGRLWQACELDRWDEAEYLYRFINEISSPDFLKKYAKELKRMELAIDKQELSYVDKVITNILKW